MKNKLKKYYYPGKCGFYYRDSNGRQQKQDLLVTETGMKAILSTKNDQVNGIFIDLDL